MCQFNIELLDAVIRTVEHCNIGKIKYYVLKSTWDKYSDKQKEMLKNIVNNYGGKIEFLNSEGRGLRSKMLIYDDAWDKKEVK